jgi:hypothetical protein
MLVILLSIIIKPSIRYGRTDINQRIGDYINSFKQWNILADKIPYKIYIFENSGFPFKFDLNDKITYISEHIELNMDGQGKGRSLAASIKRFIEISNLSDTDKLLIITGRYAPITPPYDLFDLIEKNDFVISGTAPKFGPINTEWFAGTVDTIKYCMNMCIIYCRDDFLNFEYTLFHIIKPLTVEVYSKPIPVIPTYLGGNNKPINFI